MMDWDSRHLYLLFHTLEATGPHLSCLPAVGAKHGSRRPGDGWQENRVRRTTKRSGEGLEEREEAEALPGIE